SALNEDIDRLFRRAAFLAAHHAAKAEHLFIIRDDAVMRFDVISLTIKREELFALAAEARADIALELRGVIDVKRSRTIQRDEIGDINQRVDRAKAYRLQPVLQPLGRGAV